jgi:hypothetical protein
MIGHQASDLLALVALGLFCAALSAWLEILQHVTG